MKITKSVLKEMIEEQIKLVQEGKNPDVDLFKYADLCAAVTKPLQELTKFLKSGIEGEDLYAGQDLTGESDKMISAFQKAVEEYTAADAALSDED